MFACASPLAKICFSFCVSYAVSAPKRSTPTTLTSHCRPLLCRNRFTTEAMMSPNSAKMAKRPTALRSVFVT